MNILEIKEKFESHEWEMVQDYLKGKLTKCTWFDIAKKYNIRPEGNKDQRKKAANDIWRKYIRLLERAEEELEERKINPKVLTLDIETSYNIVRSFQVGSKVFLPHDSIIEERKIITVAYKWLGSDEIVTLEWDKNQDDKELVKLLIEEMNKADEIVGHNCDKYDIPFIISRALYHRIPALAKYKSFDTYKVSKKTFNLNSYKLDYIANFLGFGRKIQHRGMELWDDIILRKCPKAMEEMLEYNIHDVELTEKVYLTLKEYSEASIHHAVLEGKDKHVCPTCGSEESQLLKTFVTKLGTKSRLMGCKCGTQFKISEKTYQDNYAGK